MSAEMFIWDVLRLSQEDGKLLTQMESKERFELAKKLSDRYGIPIHGNEQSNVEAWSLIRIITEARNKMAHGAWSMLDGSIPLVVSIRIPTEPGTINSEHFPIDRMDAMQASCWNLKKAFDAMAATARSSPRKLPEQGPQTQPSHPEHPVGGGQ